MISQITFSDALDIYFSGAKTYWYTKYWLIYKGKQYINRRERILRNKGRKKFTQALRKAATSPSPFLDTLNKGEDWTGNHIPIPIVYGNKGK